MTEHYFSDTPTGPERRQQLNVDLFGHTVTLQTANGVFAGDGLDKGTAVLLREVPPPIGSPGSWISAAVGAPSPWPSRWPAPVRGSMLWT